MIQESNDVTDGDKLNFNCVDFMGRNALHLAVDSDNLDCVEILLEKLSFESIEEALLHAIDKRAQNIVKVMIEHPTYLMGERHYQLLGKKDSFFRHEERQQFPPDITPLILAAHKNDHDIIQMFLSRGYTIGKHVFMRKNYVFEQKNSIRCIVMCFNEYNIGLYRNTYQIHIEFHSIILYMINSPCQR